MKILRNYSAGLRIYCTDHQKMIQGCKVQNSYDFSLLITAPMNYTMNFS